MQDSLLETRVCKIVYWRCKNSLLIIITLYNLTARSRHGGALPYMHVHVDFTYHVIYTGNCNFECIVLHVCHDLCKLCWCCKVFSDTIYSFIELFLLTCACASNIRKRKLGFHLK